jgi:pSer/pThr/pTyr-binding forkhead associated (FHA) protein
MDRALLVQMPGDGAKMFADGFTIGRGPGPELAIEDEYVSPQHARVSPSGGGWVIEDLGSTNGTWVNEFQIYQPLTIHKGDKVRVGRTTMIMVPA